MKSPAFFIRKSEIRCPARERTADMNNPNLNIQNVNERSKKPGRGCGKSTSDKIRNYGDSAATAAITIQIII